MYEGTNSCDEQTPSSCISSDRDTEVQSRSVKNRSYSDLGEYFSDAAHAYGDRDEDAEAPNERLGVPAMPTHDDDGLCAIHNSHSFSHSTPPAYQAKLKGLRNISSKYDFIKVKIFLTETQSYVLSRFLLHRALMAILVMITYIYTGTDCYLRMAPRLCVCVCVCICF